MKYLFLKTWKSHTEVYKWVHLKSAKGGLYEKQLVPSQICIALSALCALYCLESLGNTLFWSTTNCLLLPGSGWAMLQTLSQNCGFFIPLSLVVHCFYSLNSLFFDLLEDHHPAPKQTHGALSLLINV